MWALSRNSDLGRVTWAAAMLASPGLAVRTAFRAGFWARLVPPLSESFNLGLKGRAAQPPSWKRWVSGAELPSSERAEPVKPSSLQLVGLRVKLGLDIFRVTERTSSGMPWRMWGISSLLAVIWAVSGLT